MKDAKEELSILKKLIIDHCRPEKIILFGSFARGENNPLSDIDLLVIKNSEKKRAFRAKEVFEAVRGLKRNCPLDAIVYTPKELNDRLLLGDYFIKKIIAEGKTIYG